MYRLFPALLAFLVLTLFAVTATQAAEPVSDFFMLAQIPNMTRGPGMYLNLFKFVPVVIIYVLWAWTTNWVEHDTKELNNVRFEVWNSAVFSSGVLGLALVLAIPIYFIGLGLLLLAYFVPLMSYVYARNQTVPDDQKVLTPYHLGEVCNDILHKLGMKPLFNKDVGTIDRSGPPIVFVGKTQGSAKEDPTRVRQAEESRSYMAAKELVYDAVLRRSTDIHLEPTSEQLSVRYRIDGILHAAEPFDRPTGDAVVNVFKVLSAMDISEKRKPQDGSFGATLAGRSLDFRVATSGSKAGEKLVMRILDNSSAVTKMEDLGMRPKLIEQVRGLVTQPHGMFLCCGPTGAGKSTTLYASPARDRPVPEEHHHGRGPDRVPARQRHPDGSEHQGRADVCHESALDPAPGSGRHHDRRNPRPRNGFDRLPGCQHRAHGVLDRPLQRRGDSPVPVARPGCRAIHDRVGALGGAWPATGAAAL